MNSNWFNMSIALGVSTAFLFVGWYFGSYYATQRLYQEAVDSGVGEWVIIYEETDFSDVKRGFRWKLP